MIALRIRVLCISTLLLTLATNIPVFGYTILSDTDPRFTRTKKPWTLIVYLAADNNLYPFIEDDLNEMQKQGTNDYISVLAYVNTRLPGQKKNTKKLIVYQGETYQIGPETRMDSGDPNTLIDALTWAHTMFPSDHTAVVLWDHGPGSLNKFLGNTLSPLRWWYRNYTVSVKLMSEEDMFEATVPDPTIERGVCYDDTTGNFLTDANLRSAFETMVTKYRNGTPYDVLAFDACLMADVEVAYAVRPYVNYVVASQQTIPGTGYGYDHVLRFVKQGPIDARSFAVAMTHAYNTEYVNQTGDYTLSALDMNALDPLIDNINRVAGLLIAHLNGPNASRVRRAIRLSSKPEYCTHFDEPAYIDLGHFYRNLIANLTFMRLRSSDRSQLETLLKQGLNLLPQCVIANVKGSYFPRATGLSIYCDQYRIDSSYGTLLWSKDTHWYSMLRALRG